MIIHNEKEMKKDSGGLEQKIDWSKKAKKLAQELDYTMRFYYATLQASDHVELILDQNGIVCGVSEKAQQFFQLPMACICGVHYRNLHFPHVWLKKVFDCAVIEKVLINESGQEDYYLSVPTKEKEYTFDRIVKPILDVERKVIGIHFCLKDRSLEKELHEQSKQILHLSQIGEIAAGVVHEIRNPMQIVRAYLQLMQEKYKNDDFMQKNLPLVFAELDRGNAILTEYLQSSRVKEMHLAAYDINDLCNQVLPLYIGPALARGIQIKTDFAANMQPIMVDGSRFKQILVNMLNNALAAIETEGQIILKTVEEEDTVCLTVTDTGKGMDEETLAKIGKPFFTTKEKGTGMGVYNSFSLIKQMQGTVDIQSALGEGTSFIIRFPKLKENMMAI